jgi:hypothetical protein
MLPSTHRALLALALTTTPLVAHAEPPALAEARAAQARGDAAAAIDAYEVALVQLPEGDERADAYCQIATLLDGAARAGDENAWERARPYADACHALRPNDPAARELLERYPARDPSAGNAVRLGKELPKLEALAARPDAPAKVRDRHRDALLKLAYHHLRAGRVDESDRMSERAVELYDGEHVRCHLADVALAEYADAQGRDHEDEAARRAIAFSGACLEHAPDKEDIRDLRRSLLIKLYLRPALLAGSALLLGAALLLRRRRARALKPPS